MAAKSLPGGTYTTAATRRDALKLDHRDECALKHGGLRLRLEFRDGLWTERQTCEVRPERIGGQGSYEVRGDRLLFTEACCGTTTLTGPSTGRR